MENIISKLNTIAMDTYVSDPEKAKKYAEEALRLAQDSKLSEGVAEAYNTLGTILLAEKNYEAAFRNFNVALDNYSFKGNKKGIAKTYTNIGLYYLHNNTFSKAKDYFEKAQSTYNTLGDRIGEATSHAQMANCYRQLGQSAQAMVYHRKSLSIYNDQKAGMQRNDSEHQNPMATEANATQNVVFVESLQKEIDSRNREIASYSIVIKQKNEVLDHAHKVLNSLISNKETGFNDAQIKDINELLYKLRVSSNTYSDNDWSNFKMQFERIHPDFFTKLAKNFPSLSQNELRHCAFLKMNMNNKEVAKLLNINPKSVEIARYRIKKKLELPRSTKLFNYITRI